MPRKIPKGRQVTRDNKSYDAVRFRRAMLIAVNRQLENDDLPEVRETLDRLMAAGHSRQEAIELIADAFTKQVWALASPTQQMNVSQFSSSYKALLDELQ